MGSEAVVGGWRFARATILCPFAIVWRREKKESLPPDIRAITSIGLALAEYGRGGGSRSGQNRGKGGKAPCRILGGASQIELILQRTCKHIKQGLETILNLSSNALVIFL